MEPFYTKALVQLPEHVPGYEAAQQPALLGWLFSMVTALQSNAPCSQKVAMPSHDLSGRQWESSHSAPTMHHMLRLQNHCFG